ncbi:MAG: hypothetical protein ACRD7E_12145 [Bryobacteraceae bacterium]
MMHLPSRAITWCAIVFCAVVPTIGSAQSAASSPSVLEQALKQPDARVTSSKQIGRFDDGESHAVFTVLVVSDSTRQDRKTRGVRIDFSGSGWKRVVYLDDHHLEPLKKVLDQLTVDIERLLPRFTARTDEGYLGSCEFRDHPDLYPLQMDYLHSGWRSPALRFTSPARVLFHGRGPADLSAILGAAIEYLLST